MSALEDALRALDEAVRGLCVRIPGEKAHHESLHLAGACRYCDAYRAAVRQVVYAARMEGLGARPLESIGESAFAHRQKTVARYQAERDTPEGR